MTNPADANHTGRKGGQQQVSKKEMGLLHRKEKKGRQARSLQKPCLPFQKNVTEMPKARVS